MSDFYPEYPKEYESLSRDLTIPDKYTCDITHMLMVDPVLCDDGIIYEFRAIKAWLDKERTSPRRIEITNTRLEPCHDLRKEIQAFVRENCNTAEANDPAPAGTMAAQAEAEETVLYLFQKNYYGRTLEQKIRSQVSYF